MFCFSRRSVLLPDEGGGLRADVTKINKHKDSEINNEETSSRAGDLSGNDETQAGGVEEENGFMTATENLSSKKKIKTMCEDEIFFLFIHPGMGWVGQRAGGVREGWPAN